MSAIRERWFLHLLLAPRAQQRQIMETRGTFEDVGIICAGLWMGSWRNDFVVLYPSANGSGNWGSMAGGRRRPDDARGGNLDRRRAECADEEIQRDVWEDQGEPACDAALE